MALFQPAPLQKGDRVALIAPSGPLPEGRLPLALDAIRARGLEPVAYPSVTQTHGYLAGADAVRAQDVNDAFADDSIKGVLCARGGYGAQRLYPRVDWENIRRHPKRFLGYSDITFFHLMLTQRCGMVSYHTPMPSTEWYEGLDEYTDSWLDEALFGDVWGELPNCDKAERKTVAPGKACGELTGGNLSLVASAVGTPYAMDAKDKIVFLEDVGERPYRVDGMLNHLVQSGALSGCRGIVLGYYTDCNPPKDKPSLTLDEVFDELLTPLGVPVLSGVTCGHSTPTLSLPIGCDAELDADAQTLRIVEGEK